MARTSRGAMSMATRTKRWLRRQVLARRRALRRDTWASTTTATAWGARGLRRDAFPDLLRGAPRDRRRDVERSRGSHRCRRPRSRRRRHGADARVRRLVAAERGGAVPSLCRRLRRERLLGELRILSCPSGGRGRGGATAEESIAPEAHDASPRLSMARMAGLKAAPMTRVTSSAPAAPCPQPLRERREAGDVAQEHRRLDGIGPGWCAPLDGREQLPGQVGASPRWRR